MAARLTVFFTVGLISSGFLLDFCSSQNFDPDVEDKEYLDRIQKRLREEVLEAHSVLVNQTKILQQMTTIFIETKIKENLFKAVRARVEEELEEMTKNNETLASLNLRQARQDDEDDDDTTGLPSPPPPRPGLLPQLANVITTLFGADINVTSSVREATSFLPQDLSNRFVMAANLIDPSRFTSTTALPPLIVNGQVIPQQAIVNGSVIGYHPTIDGAVLQSGVDINKPYIPSTAGVQQELEVVKPQLQQQQTQQVNPLPEVGIQQNVVPSSGLEFQRNSEVTSQQFHLPSSAVDPTYNQLRTPLEPQSSNGYPQSSSPLLNKLGPQPNFPHPNFLPPQGIRQQFFQPQLQQYQQLQLQQPQLSSLQQQSTNNLQVGSSQFSSFQQQQQQQPNPQSQIGLQQPPPQQQFQPAQIQNNVANPGLHGNYAVDGAFIPQRQPPQVYQPQPPNLPPNNYPLNGNNNNGIRIVTSPPLPPVSPTPPNSNEDEDEDNSVEDEDLRDNSEGSNPLDEEDDDDEVFDDLSDPLPEKQAKQDSGTGGIANYAAVRYALRLINRLTRSEIPTTTEYMNSTSTVKSLDSIEEEEMAKTSPVTPTVNRIFQGGVVLFEGAREAYTFLQQINRFLDRVNDRLETTGLGADSVGIEVDERKEK